MMIDPQTLIGTCRRFGLVGPVYEIIGIGRETNTDQFMKIKILETGEEAEYSLNNIIDDPREK